MTNKRHRYWKDSIFPKMQEPRTQQHISQQEYEHRGTWIFLPHNSGQTPFQKEGVWERGEVAEIWQPTEPSHIARWQELTFVAMYWLTKQPYHCVCTALLSHSVHIFQYVLQILANETLANTDVILLKCRTLSTENISLDIYIAPCRLYLYPLPGCRATA